MLRRQRCRGGAARGDAGDRRYGGIDVLVNNAGITHRSPVANTSLAVFQRVMAVNFYGALHCTQAALPSLIARDGQIIVLSSLSQYAPVPNRAAYNASKHALHGLFETLRGELSDTGVHVMLVCPGYTATDLRKNVLVGDGSTAPSPVLDIGRVASPQDVAEAIYQGALRRRALLVHSISTGRRGCWRAGARAVPAPAAATAARQSNLMLRGHSPLP